MGKSTVSMAILNSYFSLPKGNYEDYHDFSSPWDKPLMISGLLSNMG
jgi:hypothetical protein